MCGLRTFGSATLKRKVTHDTSFGDTDERERKEKGPLRYPQGYSLEVFFLEFRDGGV